MKIAEQSSFAATFATIYCPSTSCLINNQESYRGLKDAIIYARNTETVILNGQGWSRFAQTKIYVDNAKYVYIYCDGYHGNGCNGMHIYMVYKIYIKLI